MGRSKFPGKPSKSINRKRISVLQLDPNNASETSGLGSPTPTPHHHTNTSSSSATSDSGAAATAATSSSATQANNDDDETTTQTKTEEDNLNTSDEDDEEEDDLPDKHRNGKREESDTDDDDDDEKQPPGTAAAGTTAAAGVSNGTGVQTTSSQQQQQHQQQQQTTNNNNLQNTRSNTNLNSIYPKIPLPTLSAKVLLPQNHHYSSSRHSKRINHHRKQDNIEIKTKQLQEEVPEVSKEQHHNGLQENGQGDEGEEKAKETKADHNTAAEEDSEKELSKRPQSRSSNSLSNGNLAAATASSHVKFPQRNCKKFKNLNINKPEVMLPSSAKLKLQQQQQKLLQNQTELEHHQQHHLQHPQQTQQLEVCNATHNIPAPQHQHQQHHSSSSTVSVSAAINSLTCNTKTNLAAEPVNNTVHPQQQQPQICEKSLSSLTPTLSATFRLNGHNKHDNDVKAHNNNGLLLHKQQPADVEDSHHQQQNHDDPHHEEHNDDADADADADIEADADAHLEEQQQAHLNNHLPHNHDHKDNEHDIDNAADSSIDNDDNNDDNDVDDYADVAAVEISSSHNPTELMMMKSSTSVVSSSLAYGTSESPSDDIPNDCKSDVEQTPSLNIAIAMDVTMTTSSNGSTTINSAVNCSSSCSDSSSTNGSDKKQKKTVTFKNVLETSDDKSAVKKFYNPDNRKPLISIIKKECLNRPLIYTRSSECIVRPSRLTEILKNNSNIDKLNSLKFRSSNNVTGNSVGQEAGGASSVLAGPLSRVFGAPFEDETQQQQQNVISFRLSKDTSEEDEDEEEDEDDDEEEDEDDDDEEREVEGDGDDQELEAEAEAVKTEENINNNTAGDEGGDLVAIQTDTKPAGNIEDEDDQQLIVDKHFVLPKRSCRSSRVIKPNKRLIEDGIICKKSSLKPPPSNTTHIKEEKPAVVNLPGNYFGLRDFTAKDCNGLTASKLPKDNSVDIPKASPFVSTANVFSNFTSQTASNGTVVGNTLLSSKPSSFILRQPRLQFESLSAPPPHNSSTNSSDRNKAATAAAAAALALSASIPKSLLQAISSSSSATALSNLKISSSTSAGPPPTVVTASLLSPTFSLNSTSSIKNNVNNAPPVSSLSPSSILCVVCSSTIHTKNLPQASKYGQLSCEYCRKFISKIAKKSLAIKNSTTNKPIIPHCKADGNCLILPLNKGIHIKNFKKLYKERCGLCWLKKCLQTLQLPKVRLNALLPVLNAVLGNKANIMETKLRKELEVEATKLSIKWKPSMDSPTALPSATVDSIKVPSIKTNSLTENNATFGSSPLLRPAILENPSFIKMPVETKQEVIDKPERKPLEILKDVKVEAITVDVSSSSKTKRKEKSMDKDRKEVKVKELPSPKTEEKFKDLKDHIEKSEAVEETTVLERQQVDVATNNPCAATTLTPTTATAAATSATSAATSAAGTTDKRQRIDLKGPRVKHVCRSASIVLGQPLAMFGEDEEDSGMTVEELQQSLENGDRKTPLTDENDNCSTCKTQQACSNDEPLTDPPPSKAAKVDNTTTTSSTTTTTTTTTTRGILTTSKLSQRPHHYNTQLTAYKKQFSSQMVATASSALMPHRRKEPQIKCKLLISIDFWENYDPAEVCQTGFGLIITETVAQRALCFLCGSAGQEPLIFCSCCCEPYHQYCVQDEFNLKHGSLDDTLLLNDSCLSITGLTSNTNTAIAKLNWLCPRCTVCYTCNMSSGAKVKCQKCQKNYHSTCLGTSKRLLGADRPLICVNCLKCRSCSTTKVTKFVGNLPMCTNCFKLRKKGNYCPVCQKCYDDQDFDLKMMECGDCHQWVHAKCETLTDEQYNLLSTLPESIEFICKRCSRKSSDAKQRASEWRDAVKEEFKSNLMSVLKLLSKSRQACSLLRLSPRKQMKCSCASTGTTNKYQPKALQFNQDQNSRASNIDVYEFDDQERVTEIPSQLTLEKKCICQASQNTSGSNLSLVEIKQKITNGSYGSLAEFHYDMTLVIQQANCDELVIVYKEILSEQFPWFQNETQACTDALEEDMYESSGGNYGLNNSMESESDYQMDCMPSSTDQQEEAERSALLAELPQDLDELLYNIKCRQDSRICLFCRRSCEGLPNEEGRLLYCGHDCWVHTNCALWSAEVFEEIDGSLQNVHSAVSRGRMIKCSVCGNRGATVGCNVKSCGEHYHYPCARSKNCAFLADKSMYCPAHSPSLNNSKVSFETQFDVMRPVYVELERKRKKLVEPSKVQFHIGSLEVKQLGHIMPRFSDTYEAVVPVNFLCSRLYWSSKEPWKIVEYTVRTYVHNSSNSSLSGACMDLGKNFTVDHSQNNSAIIQLGLSQIHQWHMSLAKGESDPMEEYDYLGTFPQNTACSAAGSQETSGANDEEPQTNADLLPPEIKEAIFEDLPGDLLEGISMLDIFTKCMNYEDMAQGEQSQTPLTDEDTMTSIGAFTKQLTAELNGTWPNNTSIVEDAVKLQKLKKSASPVITCDANAKNAMKRRKISENMLISLNQHQRSQKKDCGSATRRIELENTSKRTFTWSAEKRYNMETPVNSVQAEAKIRIMQVDGVDDSITEYRFITHDSSQPTIKCERCQCTYRNIESFQRHMPTCEPMSSSTSESESDHTSQNGEVTANTITLEQLQELNNKLQQQQQQQQQQQRQQAQIPFLQTIPTQTLSQLQGLQTLPLQLQNVQSLQNLQQLQQLQQLTQPQALGGNFFISATQPDVSTATTTPDLHMYANTLQGLAANLNGTFTLQPSAFTTTPQLAQTQPQLLAVSTNADGTQQIIQLPAQNTAPTATYQTLQATNSDKKIILPVGGGKPMKTMATKAAQQAAAKNKLKATTAVKPIQSKINLAQPTQMQPPQTVNTAQLLNQQLLQQLQQAQQSAAQPQIVFQTSATQQQPQLIMQQPQNIISFVTTTNDGSQQPQLQYVTLPTAQHTHEYKPQTQASTLFTTANTQPLLQNAYLQTDASGNLVLSSTPQQTTTPLQVINTPQGPQLIGTLIQPQTLQLQGGNVITTSGADGGIPQAGSTQTQQQVIISGGAGSAPNGLEMLTTTGGTPQVILATSTPPMYYGLETIVQNTVMSSQQFVSTAMPGVLSQNASFSATTTQVFQASKIEPLVDIPAGYVLLNNVDANNTILQPQQQTATSAQNAATQANQANFIQAALQQQAAAAAAASLAEQQQQQQQSHNNVYRIQTPPVVSTAQTYQLQPQIVVAQSSAQPQASQQTNNQHTTQYLDTNTGTVYSAKVTPVAQAKRTKTTTPVATVSKVQPQVVNKVMPTVTQVSVPQVAQQQKVKQPVQVTQQPPTKVTAQIPTAPVNNNHNQVAMGVMQNQASLTSAVKLQNSAEATANTNTTHMNAPPAPVTNKKTNLIRPLNKAEVKPKVMKTATVTVATKPTPVLTPVAQNVANNQTTINNSAAAANKMVVLKPQQQQQETEQVIDNMLNHVDPQQQQQQQQQHDDTLLTISNLSENSLNPEYINLQHVTNNHQQHYNVADALLLDEINEMEQQPLSHCSFSNTNNNFETTQQQQQHQQHQHQHQHMQQQSVQQVASENVNNILPTIQRMPQYTNINIVNPLQQYPTTNTLTSSNTSTTTSSAVTRPTNRVLPMQQKQYEQHSTCSNNNTSSSTHTVTSAFCASTTSATDSLHSSAHTTTTTMASAEEASTMIKTNINKIAYEAEVKQMLLHSPNPQHEIAASPQQHMQQQHAMHMQHQQTTLIHKSSPPPLVYDISEKTTEETSKICYVNDQMHTYVNETAAEECLITDPKFPPEGEVILGSDCCENDEEALNSVPAEENDEEEDDDDGFSLKMPSTNCSDNLSMDSDEPAVKEKISKILDNLTNEDCNDSLNTNTTLEAQAELNCNAVNYLPTPPNQMQTSEQHGQISAESADFYDPSAGETTALIVAQLAVENITEELQEKAQLQHEVEDPLPNDYIEKCQNSAMPQEELIDQAEEQQQNITLPPSNLSLPTTNPPPQPPMRNSKRVSGPHLLYEIQSEDGFTYKSTSISEVWEKVFEAVQVARRAHGLSPLPEGPLADMSGVQMIGLKTNALKYLIEQLPGVEKCSKYTPKYHRRNSYASANSFSNPNSSSSSMGTSSISSSLDVDGNSVDYTSDQEELTENPYDSARCEPYSKRSEYDMFSWLASRHRKQPVQVFVQPSDTELVPRRGTGSNLPMAMKYRTLKETYKDYVGVFRSHIHGRGLYCTKDIEAGEMVIEYAGELIRSTLTDHRERYYNSRGIGCYMFKIDDHLVVDATMRGNAARFINHSCEPNCYSKVVDILGHKHIIIFALRRIVQGEELTYDYKFPFEDEKIPCSCGSKRCRKYLN